MKRLFFLITAVVFLSVSCKSTQKTQDVAKKEHKYELTKDTKWIMTSFHGKVPAEAGFRKRLPYVYIDKEKGSISGNSGCNSFSGSAEISGNKIKAGRIAATKAYCMGVPEHEFFTDLDEMDSFKIKGNKLSFMKGGEVIMEFEAEGKSKE